MNMNLGDIFAILTALCWSSAVILFDLSGRLFSSIQISLIKNFIGVIGFICTIFIFDINLFDFSFFEIITLLLSGIIGVAIGDLLFLKSLSIVGSGISAIIATAYAPTIILFAFIFFNEVITKYVFIGAILISCAIIIGTAEKILGITKKQVFKAVLFGLLAQLLTAISVLMVRPIMEDHSIISIALIRFGIGLLITFLFLWIKNGTKSMELTFRLGLKNPFIIMGSILGTYLSVIFWLAGFKYTLAGRAAIYNELSFILIIIMASVFLKESMTKRKWVAVVIAVIGALIVSFN